MIKAQDDNAPGAIRFVATGAASIAVLDNGFSPALSNGIEHLVESPGQLLFDLDVADTPGSALGSTRDITVRFSSA